MCICYKYQEAPSGYYGDEIKADREPFSHTHTHTHTVHREWTSVSTCPGEGAQLTFKKKALYFLSLVRSAGTPLDRRNSQAAILAHTTLNIIEHEHTQDRRGAAVAFTDSLGLTWEHSTLLSGFYELRLSVHGGGANTYMHASIQATYGSLIVGTHVCLKSSGIIFHSFQHPPKTEMW